MTQRNNKVNKIPYVLTWYQEHIIGTQRWLIPQRLVIPRSSHQMLPLPIPFWQILRQKWWRFCQKPSQHHNCQSLIPRRYRSGSSWMVPTMPYGPRWLRCTSQAKTNCDILTDHSLCRRKLIRHSVNGELRTL